MPCNDSKCGQEKSQLKARIQALEKRIERLEDFLNPKNARSRKSLAEENQRLAAELRALQQQLNTHVPAMPPDAPPQIDSNIPAGVWPRMR